MSVAFESNTSSDSNRIQSLGFSNGMWIYNLSDSGRFTGGNPWSNRLPVVKEEDDSGTSSSIGNNSDALSGGSGGGGGSDSDEDDGEVQSKVTGPLNGLTELEQVLPIRKGISTFYAGKSKSYGSLADACSVPSIQDIVKREDAYSRKRKNLLAHHVLLSKRLARNSHDSDENGESSSSSMSMAGPLPGNSRRLSANESSDSSPRLYASPWRSLSLSDLQNASAASSSIKENEYDVYH